MEKYLNKLRTLSQNNKKMKIYFAVEYDNILDKWVLDIGSSYCATFIYYESTKDLKEFENLLENGIKELKKFIDEFEWE